MNPKTSQISLLHSHQTHASVDSVRLFSGCLALQHNLHNSWSLHRLLGASCCPPHLEYFSVPILHSPVLQDDWGQESHLCSRTFLLTHSSRQSLALNSTACTFHAGLESRVPGKRRLAPWICPKQPWVRDLLWYHHVVYSGTSRHPLVTQKRSQSTMFPNGRQQYFRVTPG